MIDIPLSEFSQVDHQVSERERFPGGAPDDMIPNLTKAKNPLPYDPMTQPRPSGGRG